MLLTAMGCDNTPRWAEFERLHHLFEKRCDAAHNGAGGNTTAVITPRDIYTFGDIDERANQLAHYLIARGVKPGDRIGLVFDKSAETYIALLSVLKAGAAYVPLDAGFPNERIGFILEDAGVTVLLSMAAYRAKLEEFTATQIYLDADAESIGKENPARLTDAKPEALKDALAYIIYTSGTTGKPKGVAINHSSVCNFVKVAIETYGYKPSDRFYQGMTIAFDFSVEELWVPLLAGAALVPAKPGATLVGDDLADFLIAQHITGFCCVPTLLATIEKDLPDLRMLMVSGEACPQNLMARWYKPGRTILNTYGPTEATVTATVTELRANKPVTIGVPLPTYTIVILDPEKDAALPSGASGEIGIAGIGLAEGYLNRPDLTAQKFIKDFLDLPNNPSKRIYRTGDLGRINAAGEIEYQGRIDTQVKIRGYRIELTEIESLLMEFPQIAVAVVEKCEPEPGLVELVAYYSLKHGATDLPLTDVVEELKSRLPPYMVPAYFEKLPFIPMTTSNKADRRNLPKPTSPRVSTVSGSKVAPRNELEEILANALAKALKVGSVSVEDDFFKVLGAHSLLLARFCSDIRQNPAIAAVSMRDVYLNPTVASLARHLGAVSAEMAAPVSSYPRRIPTRLEYFGCGALQLLYYIAYGGLGLWLAAMALEWSFAAIDDPWEQYKRLFILSTASFVLTAAIPIAVKWLVVGRWKEEAIPVWSLRYFKFWVVKSQIQANPLSLFRGSPMYNIYLRMLGAKIGANALIASKYIPVCTDLISIGPNTVLKESAVLLGYKARFNYIHTGPVSIGANAFVGQAGILDTHTVMEDDTQLGHASFLPSGQRIPKGKHFHGSPAQETQAAFCIIEPKSCTPLRRTLYSGFQLIGILSIFSPLGLMLVMHVLRFLFEHSSAATLTVQTSAATFLPFAIEVLEYSLVTFFGFLLIALLVVVSVPRILNLFLRENETYVLYGTHYVIHRAVKALSNSSFFCILFGDSSLIVPYMQAIGYRLHNVIQFGSNFGQMQKHDNPFLCEIGTGTMVADGLAMMNTTTSNTSFRLNRTIIGDYNYLGNGLYYPAGGKTGSNCLLATKVMIPIDGPVRENVGLLGSPCFEIPRAVERDRSLVRTMDEDTRAARIRAKLRHNLLTMAAFLASIWVYFFAVLLAGFLTLLNFREEGMSIVYAFAVFASIAGILWSAFIERASLGFRPLTPKVASMYDLYFWQHERHWKLAPSGPMGLFKGTPFKNWVSRLLGVRLGKMVFDDGCSFCEKSLIEIGDYTNLNDLSMIQGHSLEEGAFKSDYIRIGRNCALGSAALVHYGVSLSDNVIIEPDSFLMKGEAPELDTIWQGNPARAVGRTEPLAMCERDKLAA